VSVGIPGRDFPVISSPAQTPDGERNLFLLFLFLFSHSSRLRRILFPSPPSFLRVVVVSKLSHDRPRVEAPQNDRPFRRPRGEDVPSSVPVSYRMFIMEIQTSIVSAAQRTKSDSFKKKFVTKKERERTKGIYRTTGNTSSSRSTTVPRCARACSGRLGSRTDCSFWCSCFP